MVPSLDRSSLSSLPPTSRHNTHTHTWSMVSPRESHRPLPPLIPLTEDAPHLVDGKGAPPPRESRSLIRPRLEHHRPHSASTLRGLVITVVVHLHVALRHGKGKCEAGRKLAPEAAADLADAH